MSYAEKLINKLIEIISKSVDPDFLKDYKVRLATLELAIRLIKKIVAIYNNENSNDFYLACIEQAKEQSSFILRRLFKVNFLLLSIS